MDKVSLKELEANLLASKESIELNNALQRLMDNKDFKKVVINGYFSKEAIRLVLLKGKPGYQGDVEQKNIIAKIDAIGNFSNYLDSIAMEAELAIKNSAADEQTRDEIIFEGLDNE
jgi:hypothetical protein